jgi:carnitine O-palmitoyltransferase 2
MSDASASMAAKAAALRAAVTKHSELTKNGVMGQGFDRHLFALKKMAALGHMDEPALFKLPSHAIMGHIILSTSTLSSPHLDGGSFGPVNEDCYGIGYGIESHGSLFQLASYRTDLPDMRDLLLKSLQDIEQVLIASSKGGNGK